MSEMNVEMIKEFLKIETIKFGQFTLKSGNVSPIYIDMRMIISYPELLKSISDKVKHEMHMKNLSADVICGVPYTALPIATLVSVSTNIPMVMKRKEAKDYGTLKMVEGAFKACDRCLIIEDIVTTGQSVIETVEFLRKEGLLVTDCIVILDRQQGGKANLATSGIKMHSLFYIQSVVDIIAEHKLVSSSLIGEVKNYFEKNKIVEIKEKNQTRLSFKKRRDLCCNPILKKLFSIMDQKKTNLCLAADVQNSSELLQLAGNLGPYICILKVHIDILGDFNEDILIELQGFAQKHNFLLMEDRKFADIGNTVKQQYQNGIYKIQSWADIVTVHSLPGEGILQGLKSCDNSKACVLIAQMSSAGALTTKDYVSSTVEMAVKYSDFVIGFISQSAISSNLNFVHMCPGINLESSGDKLGQQYRMPEEAVKNARIDIIIVGRGIIGSENIVEMAMKYQKKGFEAYIETVTDVN